MYYVIHFHHLFLQQNIQNHLLYNKIIYIFSVQKINEMYMIFHNNNFNLKYYDHILF